MSLTAYQNSFASRALWAREKGAVSSWRKDHNRLQDAIFLRHQRHQLDWSELDQSFTTLQELLERQADLRYQLGVLRELITAFQIVIQRAEEKNADTYTLRKKLLSLEYRARTVLNELEKSSRAPEFDEKALRKILQDYQDIRN